MSAKWGTPKTKVLEFDYFFQTISPGLAETEFTYRAFPDNPELAKSKHSQFEVSCLKRACMVFPMVSEDLVVTLLEPRVNTTLW